MLDRCALGSSIHRDPLSLSGLLRVTSISLARKYPEAIGLTERALKQAARELLLAQSSDWAFILRSGTSPEYARKRVKDHLLRFLRLGPPRVR